MGGIISSWMLSRARQGLWLVALATFAALSSGCTLLECTSCQTPKPLPMPVPPQGQPSTILSYWDSKFVQVPDPFHNGDWSPCLLGRLLMLPPKGAPICCDGSVVVTAYVEQAGSNEPVTEQWTISSDNLKKLIAKDNMGWGYTLALPTATCPKCVGPVVVKVQFEPEHGNTIYAQPNTIRFNSTEIATRNSTYVPVVHGPGPVPANGQPAVPGMGPTLPPPSQQQAMQARYQPAPAGMQVTTLASSTQNVLRQNAPPPVGPGPSNVGYQPMPAPQQAMAPQTMPVSYQQPMQQTMPAPYQQPMQQPMPVSYQQPMQQPMPVSYQQPMQQTMPAPYQQPVQAQYQQQPPQPYPPQLQQMETGRPQAMAPPSGAAWPQQQQPAVPVGGRPSAPVTNLVAPTQSPPRQAPSLQFTPEAR